MLNTPMAMNAIPIQIIMVPIIIFILSPFVLNIYGHESYADESK